MKYRAVWGKESSRDFSRRHLPPLSASSYDIYKPPIRNPVCYIVRITDSAASSLKIESLRVMVGRVGCNRNGIVREGMVGVREYVRGRMVGRFGTVGEERLWWR